MTPIAPPFPSGNACVTELRKRLVSIPDVAAAKYLPLLPICHGFPSGPIPGLPVAIRAAEQALADTSIAPASERDGLWQRVSNFKAHPGKMARQREDYYLQIRCKMLAPIVKQPDAIAWCLHTARSSSFLPDFNCAMTHLGRLPLPDQVSPAFAGFRYLGRTFGYGRCRAFDSAFLTGLPRSRLRRRSSSRFSLVIVFWSARMILFRRSQSSSTDILSKSDFKLSPRSCRQISFELKAATRTYIRPG